MTEEELNLWKRCRQGDRAAREELILRYTATLVKFWVRKLRECAPWAEWKDLMHEGVMGLIRAVDRFEPERGYEFSTLARHYVVGAICDSNEFGRGLTRRPKEIWSKIREGHDRLASKLERKPTLGEIAKEVGLTVSQVEKAMKARAIAFAAGIGEGDSDEPGRSELEAANLSPLDEQKRQESRILVQDALAKLSETDAEIIIWYYWGDESDAEIATRLGITEAAARKRRQRALKKLRRLLEGEEGK